MGRTTDKNKTNDQNKEVSIDATNMLDLDIRNKQKPVQKDIDEESYNESQQELFDEYNWWTA